MWEDETCKDGGRIVLRMPKSHANKYWEDIQFAMIGEQFREANEVLGVVL
jgi:translation initiation factor 4E